jgi:hypothetical protein
MHKDGTGKLDFIQNFDYKFIELLSLEFFNSPEETVRKHIAYRYGVLKTKFSMLNDRINTINNIIKVKNPSLMLQIQKTPSKTQNISVIKNTNHGMKI